MFLRCLRAELQKCRRSPVWLAFVLLPVFPAILGTGNYLGNIEVLDDAWYSLWSQHTLFSSIFFLPALLGVFCAWQWRLEHTAHNWNSFLTAPVPAGGLYAAKLVLAAGISLLAQVCIGVLFLISGKKPELSWIQIIYYSFAASMYALALTYLTSAIQVFFKDMAQIVGICLQFGMWLTPIMYSEQLFLDKGLTMAPMILKLNPFYYIVAGYRDSMLTGSWFFERPTMTIYFWVVTFILMIIGLKIFKKLRPHFSDVL